jgi:N-acylneuraminate cytidylyltransferase/CMP-N,N'-diacetyllegionaminic acid synthase
MDPAASGLLILVPARAGSKGLPGKNVRLLGGLPLLAWTARTIATAALPGRVVLSTDDPAIAKIGCDHGLDAPFLRPAELASDTAGMSEVVEHAVGWLEANTGWSASAVMLLQPTSPFRRAERLRQAVELLARPDTDGVIGVERIERRLSVMYHERPDGLLEPLRSWEGSTRRQEAPPLLTPNGTLYLVTRTALDTHRRLFPPRLRALPTDAIEGIDIDTPEDWALAEAVVCAGLVKP